MCIGFKFGNECSTQDKAKRLRSQVGTLVTFCWKCMASVQKHAGKPALATNHKRSKFSKELSIFLLIPDTENVNIESVTLSIMILHPIMSRCKAHHDKMNCVLYSYSKTGTLNIVLSDNYGIIYLWQIILNF